MLVRTSDICRSEFAWTRRNQHIHSASGNESSNTRVLPTVSECMYWCWLPQTRWLTIELCRDRSAADILQRKWYILIKIALNPESSWYYFHYFLEVLVMKYVNTLYFLRGVLTQKSVFHFSIGLLSLFDFSGSNECALVGGVRVTYVRKS